MVDADDINWMYGKIIESPVITLTGDVSGQATMVEKGNVTIPTTLTVELTGVSSWNDLTDKPTEFPPEDHNHPWSEISDKPDSVITLSGDVTGSGTMVDLGNVVINTTVISTTPISGIAWDAVTNKPDVFPPEDHTHDNDDITSLDYGKLTNVPPTAHDHPEYLTDVDWSIIDNVPATFPPSAHTHDNDDIIDVDFTKVLNVPDPIITLTGDVSGQGTIIDLGNVTITTQVLDDSHEHSNYSNINHVHDYSELENIPPSAAPEWDDIVDKPTEFPPEAHNQDWSTITNTPTAYNPESHLHGDGDLLGLDWSKVTNKPDISIELTGDVEGYGTFTDLASGSIGVTVNDDSHEHSDASLQSIAWSKVTNKPDPTITLTGDVSGSGTMTDLGNVSIITEVLDDSHEHTDINLLKEINTNRLEPTGIVNHHEDLFLGFDNSTLTFSLSANDGGDIVYYVKGVKYVTQLEQITLDDTNGLWFIYFDVNGDIQKSQIPWEFENTAQIATVYWNTTLNQGFLGNECHGIAMDWRTHEYLHETVGSRYAHGLTGTFPVTGLTIGIGEWYDEDIEWENEDPITTCRVLYRTGGIIHWTASQSKYYHEVSDIIQYDNNGSLADVDNNKYVAYWIFAINGQNDKIVSVMGQRQDTTIANARANNTYEGLTLLLAAPEMKLLYRVILQRSGTNEVFVEAQDYRSTTTLAGGTTYTPTDHGTLAGLTDPDHPASAITASTTNFAGKLSAADDTVQKALDTIDDHSHAFSEITAIPDSTITLTGDVSGAGTMTDLGNVSILVEVKDDSHEHSNYSNVNHVHDYNDLENIPPSAMIGWDDIIDKPTEFTPEDHTHPWSEITEKPDISIELTGDVEGYGTFTDLASGSIGVTVNDDSHQHSDTTLTGLDWSKILNKPDLSIDFIGDVVGYVTFTDMVSAQVSIAVNDDSHNHSDTTLTSIDWSKILNKPDLSIELTGDVSGYATFTDMVSATLGVTVNDDSHNHSDDTLTSLAWSKLTGIPDSVITITGAATGSGTMTDLASVSINVSIGHPKLTDLLQDDHTQYPLMAGRAGGQYIYGGLESGDALTLVGNTLPGENYGNVVTSNILPGLDSTYILGNVSFKWLSSHITTLNTSTITAMTTAGMSITDKDDVLGVFVADGGNVGIRNNAPIFPLDVLVTSSNGIRVMNTAALGAGSGGSLAGYVNAFPTAADQRLGRIIFGATNGVQSAETAIIAAFSEEVWNYATARGTYLRFETLAPGTVSRSEKMRLTGAGDLCLGTTSPSGKFTLNDTLDLSLGYNEYSNIIYTTITGEIPSATNINKFGIYNYQINEGTQSGTGRNNSIGSYNYVTNIDTSSCYSLSGGYNYTLNNSNNNITYIYGNINIAVHNGIATATTCIGSYSLVQTSGLGSIITTGYNNRNAGGAVNGGSVTTFYSVYSLLSVSTSGNITTGYCFYADSTTATSGTIGTIYGLYIDTLAGTTTWGVYQAGATDKNYFAGAVGIGSNDFDSIFLNVKLGVYSATDYCSLKIRTDGTGTSAFGSVSIGSVTETNNLWLLSHHTDRLITRSGITLGGWTEIYSGGAGNTGGLLINTASNTPIVFGTNNTEKMRLTADGFLGIGTLTPTYPLDIVGKVTGGYSQILLADTAANNTIKYGRIFTRPYANSDTYPVFLIGSTSNSTVNNVIIGGGSATATCATAIYFYTAAAVNTITGSLRMLITAAGNIGFNGLSTFGDNAAGVIGITNGTAPTTSPADAVQLWSANRGGTDGKAGLHIRSEDGTSHVFSDRVGIGTITPSVLFHVYGGSGRFDRGATTSALTREIAIGGARSTVGGIFAEINFENYDTDTTTDYEGAAIRAIASDAAGKTELRIYLSNAETIPSTTFTSFLNDTLKLTFSDTTVVSGNWPPTAVNMYARMPYDGLQLYNYGDDAEMTSISLMQRKSVDSVDYNCMRMALLRDGDGGLASISFVMRYSAAVPELLRLYNTGNISFNAAGIGTNALKVLSIASGTAPTTSPADAVQIWSADRGATAGKAGLHIRSEDGTSHVFSDRVGIGTVSPSYPFDTFQNIANHNSTLSRFYVNSDLGASSTYYSITTSIYNFVNANGDYAYNNSGYQRGLHIYAAVRNNIGTLTTLEGMYIDYGAYGNGGADLTGTITSVYGITINGLKVASATITNGYGILIQNTKGSTLSYDLYCATTTASVYFANNVGISIASNGFGTSATKTLGIGNGVAPGSSPADMAQIYSADQAAGNACIHTRTENGAIIKLFQGAALTAQLTTITYTEPAVADYAISAMTSSTPFGWANANEANTCMKVIANLQTRVAELETRLKAHGLLA